MFLIKMNYNGAIQCGSADWNPKDTNVWGESAHYTKGM